jgi:hypothetical protein
MRAVTLALLACTLLVAALTGALYGLADRYEPDGRAWLANPGFAPDPAGRPAGWEIEGPPGAVQALAGGGVRLTNLDPAGRVGLRQVLRRERGDASVFDLAAVVASEGIAGGRPGWRPGRVTLAVDGEDDEVRGRHVELANVRGSSPPRVHQRRFTFGARIGAVELALRLRTATGSLVVRDLSITGLVERPGFRAAAWALRAAWAGLFAGWLWLGLRGLRRPGGRLVLGASATGAALLLLLPVDLRHALTEEVSRKLLGGLVSAETAGQVGHVAIFLTLGWLVRWLRPRDPLPLSLAALTFAAGAAELAQFLADARQPSADDWACNALGAALGVGLAWLASRAPGPAPASGGAASEGGGGGSRLRGAGRGRRRLAEAEVRQAEEAFVHAHERRDERGDHDDEGDRAQPDRPPSRRATVRKPSSRPILPPRNEQPHLRIIAMVTRSMARMPIPLRMMSAEA